MQAVYNERMLHFRNLTPLDLALAACVLAVGAGAGYVGYRVYEAKSGSITNNLPAFMLERSAVLGDSDTAFPPDDRPPENKPRKAAPIKPGKADPKFMDKLKQYPETVPVPMTDVIGSNTRADALVRRQNGELQAGIRAFVPMPPEGAFYQGWIMKELPRKLYVPLGVFELQNDGTFLLTKTISPTYPEFDQLVITIESTGDRQPERHVLEGPIPE